MPQATDPQQSKGWASHRSNENVIRALASSKVHNLTPEETLAWIGGLIGPAAASELVTFLTQLDLPDTMGVLDGKVDWAPSKTRLDINTAVMFNCAARIAANPHKGDANSAWVARASRFWTLAAKVRELGHSDALVVPGSQVLAAGYKRRVCPEARAVTAAMAQLVALDRQLS